MARGLLGAAFLLFVVMIVAVALGVGLVGFWVEEPVFAEENLLFDYSQANPTAVFAMGFGVEKQMEVPVGQTYYVDLVLVMPESYYNVDIGMFQVNIVSCVFLWFESSVSCFWDFCFCVYCWLHGCRNRNYSVDLPIQDLSEIFSINRKFLVKLECNR